MHIKNIGEADWKGHSHKEKPSVTYLHTVWEVKQNIIQERNRLWSFINLSMNIFRSLIYCVISVTLAKILIPTILPFVCLQI